jgi:hypothetical protein
VESDEYLLTLTRYVHLNPVKTKAARHQAVKERIRMLEEWAWSSYPGYVGSRPSAPWVDYAALQHYGRTPVEARRRYRAYTHAMVWEDDEPLRALMERSAHALGSEEYVERVERELSGGKTGQAKDADVQRPWRGVELTAIDQQVAKVYQIETRQLRKHGRSAGEAKAVAVELAARWSGLTQREIGAHYGGISGQAVYMVRQRLKKDREINWSRLEKALF